MKKILVAIPCNNYVELDCIDSLIKTINKLKNYCEINVQFYSGYSCEMARNNAIADIINTDYDYLFFIDSDIKLESNSLETLILSFEQIENLEEQHNCGIITGIYFRKQNNEKIAEICRVEENKTFFYQENEIPKNTIFQIDGCGFGCVLIKRSVCEHLFKEKNGKPFNYQYEPEIISEDLWFCNLASYYGYEIMCNSEVKVGHIGKKIY